MEGGGLVERGLLTFWVPSRTEHRSWAGRLLGPPRATLQAALRGDVLPSKPQPSPGPAGCETAEKEAAQEKPQLLPPASAPRRLR